MNKLVITGKGRFINTLKNKLSLLRAFKWFYILYLSVILWWLFKPQISNQLIFLYYIFRKLALLFKFILNIKLLL